MAITFVGSDVADGAASEVALDLTMPTVLDGDVGIVFSKSDVVGTTSLNDQEVGQLGWMPVRWDASKHGRDHDQKIWVKVLTAGEDDVSVHYFGKAEERSCSLHVFRGVDVGQVQDVALVFATQNNSALGANPAIVTATDNAMVLLFQGLTLDDVTVAGAPAGFTIGEGVAGGTKDHRQHFCAYDLDVGAAGTVTPGVWTHTASPTTAAEADKYTLAFRAQKSAYISGVNGDGRIGEAENNVSIYGGGFEALQGTGKLELGTTDDYGTATLTTQTIDSWADDQIQFDVVDTSLTAGDKVYAYVTTDSGVVSHPFPVVLGKQDYDNAIIDVRPDHWWQLNNSYDDDGTPRETSATAVPATDDVQGGGGAFVTTPVVCELNTHFWHCDGDNVRRAAANNIDMNEAYAKTARTIGGWIVLGGIQQTLSTIWKEGGATNNLAFVIGLGNRLMAQYADVGDDNAQAYSDFLLEPDRPYHIMLRFSHGEDPAELRLFIDGVEQSSTSGNPLTAGGQDIHASPINFGDADVNIEMGGTDIAFVGQEDCYYAQWASWSRALYKTEEIRDVLFHLGAPAEVTIASDTAANMQIDLDTYADTVRPNYPISFRVEAATDVDDLMLDADNITFDPSTTLHIEWIGSGTLTWANTNGSNADGAKTLATHGGSVQVVAAPTITINTLDFSTLVPIEDARVLLVCAAGGPLPGDASVTITRSGSTATVAHTAHGLETGDDVLIEGADQSEYNGLFAITVVDEDSYTFTVSGTPTTPATGAILSSCALINALTNVSGEASVVFQYTADQPVSGRARKHDDPFYRTANFSGVILLSGLDQNVFLIGDE